MRRATILCGVLSLLGAGQLWATTVWNPAANGIVPPDVGNWNDAANWTKGVPATPTNNDTKAVFNVNNAAECHVTDYQTGFYFVMGDNGTSNGVVVRVKSGGHIEGSVSINGWCAIGYNRPAHMIVETGGQLTTGSGQHLWIGLNAGGVGTLDINGGTVSVGQMLGLGWGGGVGYLNVNDGGTLILTQLHGDGSSSIRGNSRLNITGTGQVIWPGAHTSVFANYVANDLIVANGTPDDVIITETNGETIVTAAVVPPDPELRMGQASVADGTLAFAWSDIPGKQFDLISSQDLAVPVDTWAPYNDGVKTHENIPNSGTGTNVLSGVLPTGGPPRFFAIRKEFGTGLALFMETFDDTAGLPEGWTSGANAGDSGSTAWEAGAPSSVGPATASSPSNCVATGISANYGANVDIWLRTPEIDLTGVTDASLLFRQSRELEAIKDNGSVRVLKASDGTQLGDDLPVIVGGTDAGAWADVEVDLPPEALDEVVKIEFQFQADAANEVLWNAGFEFPVLADGDALDADGPTWVRGRYDGTGTNWFDNTDLTAQIWNPNTDTGFGSIPEGQNVGVVTAKYDFDTAIKQTLPINLEANTQYDLSFSVGSPYANGLPGEFNKEIPDYRVELVAGIGKTGVVVAAETGVSPASFQNQWASHSLSYTSGASPEHLGKPLEIRLVAVAKGTSTGDLDGVHGQRLAYDNLVLTIAPDPGDIGLAGWYIDDVQVTGPIP